MKNASVPVALLTPLELEEVRAYKREIAANFRARRKAGITMERDRLGIGCHKPVAELNQEQVEARRAYFRDAQKRWRETCQENATKARERTSAWREKNKPHQSAYRKAYYKKLSKERIAEYHRSSLYGVTPEEYEVMLLTQCGQCAICGNVMEKPHIDHDHATGRIRGLLCGQCNTGIGNLKERPENFIRALDYLDA